MAIFEFKARWRESHQELLSRVRAEHLSRACEAMIQRMEDPLTSEDVVDSLAISLSEIQLRLEKMQERNMYTGRMNMKKRKKVKREKMADILK